MVLGGLSLSGNAVGGALGVLAAASLEGAEDAEVSPSSGDKDRGSPLPWHTVGFGASWKLLARRFKMMCTGTGVIPGIFNVQVIFSDTGVPLGGGVSEAFLAACEQASRPSICSRKVKPTRPNQNKVAMRSLLLAWAHENDGTFCIPGSSFTICFTICLCISPDLDEHQGNKDETLTLRDPQRAP
jgi:hypothetical protein